MLPQLEKKNIYTIFLLSIAYILSKKEEFSSLNPFRGQFPKAISSPFRVKFLGTQLLSSAVRLVFFGPLPHLNAVIYRQPVYRANNFRFEVKKVETISDGLLPNIGEAGSQLKICRQGEF